jgi:hypothetical protein
VARGRSGFDGSPDEGRIGFDDRHFVFCDPPGLLRLVVGRATIRSFRRETSQTPIVLYVRDRVVETKATHPADDEAAIARHVAIHQALAEDHQALVARWGTCLASASGRGGTTWPLSGQINSRVGTLLVGLTWEMPPESRDGAEWDSGYRSLRTEVTAFGDAEKSRWVLESVDEGTRATHVIGPRRYALTGAPHVSFDRIARLVEESELVRLAFGPKVTVSLRELANERRLQAAVAIIEQLLHAQATSDSPYR